MRPAGLGSTTSSCEFIAHVDGRVDDEALARYVAAYQSVTHLTLGELWSVAIMLRLALIENLRRVAVSISWQRAHRDRALAWAQRIDAPSDKHDAALLVLADMVRENPPLSTAFVAQFTQALQGRGATTTFVLAWLEQRLAERGQTIEEVVRAESQSQAADQASMANSIASLRLVNATEWHKFVEANSATEEILRGDPAGRVPPDGFHDPRRVPPRGGVHGAAAAHRRGGGGPDGGVAGRRASRRAAAPTWRPTSATCSSMTEASISSGRCAGSGPAGLFPRHLLRGLRLLAYLGPVALLSAAGVIWLVVPGATARPLSPGPCWLLGAVLAASQCAIAAVNWFASLIRRPRTLPRMDFEHGIPDALSHDRRRADAPRGSPTHRRDPRGPGAPLPGQPRSEPVVRTADRLPRRRPRSTSRATRRCWRWPPTASRC